MEESNLHQAVEWIALGLKHIPQKYEIVVRKIEQTQDSNKKEIDHSKRLLFLALL